MSLRSILHNCSPQKLQVSLALDFPLTMKISRRDKKLCTAWKKAAFEIGVEFSTPFCIQDTDGKEHFYLGLVHQVGSSSGTLIASADTSPSGNDREREYALSLLAYKYYSYFKPAVFTETILEWGWCGKKGEEPNVFKT